MMIKINENLCKAADHRNWANVGSIIVAGPYWRGGYTQIEGGKTYTFSKQGGNRMQYHFFDIEPKPGDPVGPYVNVGHPFTFTAPDTAQFLFWYVANDDSDVLVKIEEGTEATLWVPAEADLTAEQMETLPPYGEYKEIKTF